MLCSRCSHPADAGARFCSQCGTPLAAAGSDAGERRHATIVFSDLCGYTALNERLDPEEVEEIMLRVKRAAQRAVERHGGTVNQFVGDEVMALFGVPVARRDDAARAVRAALDLHAAVQDLSDELAARVGGPIAMHSGIQTGLVIARQSDDRAGRFLVTGDAVNTAARLLKLAGDGELVVGPDTWLELEGRFDGSAGAPTEVKGKEKPIVPWRVRGERDAPAVTLAPPVGRADELAAFDALARRTLTQEHGGTLLLCGEPGIGKTRLAAACLQAAQALGFATHRALVLDFQAERGADAVRTLARPWLPLLSEAGPPERQVGLAELLDQPMEPTLRALAAAMPEPVRLRASLDAWRSLARAAAGQQPRLVLIEDLHWADAWTLAHVQALAELAAQAPLLLLGTTRPEGRLYDGSAGEPSWPQLALGPLSPDAMAALAARFEQVAPAVAERLVQRAEGNPLFLEQLLLHAGEQAQHDLPGSIQGLVLARLDRLPGGDRQALQAAAVLGQRFTLEALRWLLEDPAQDCASLRAQLLLRPEGEAWLFAHALIRDGAYAALLKSRRRQLHARAAQWYRERDPVLAAEHLERAESPEAPSAFLLAARGLAERHQYEAALALLGRGQALATLADDRQALAAARGQVLLELGRADEALQAWEQALALAADDVQRSRCHVGAAAALRLVDRGAEGLARLAQAEPLVGGPTQALDRARLLHLRGNLCFGLGRIDDCVRAHEAALQAAQEAGSAEAQAQALGGLGDAWYMRGRLRSAHAQFQRCVALARAGGFGRIEVANLHMVGWTSHALNRLDEAIATSEECLALARTVSHRRVEMISCALVGYVRGWLMGDLEIGQAHLDRGLRLARKLGALRFEGQLMTYAAQLALRGGDRVRAQALAREALAFCQRTGMAFIGPVALGLVARLSDDPDERLRLEQAALAVLDAGAVSHCHLEFLAHAIDGALERSDGEAVEAHCQRLARYTADEPLPLTEFALARARTLRAWADGDRSPARRAQLDALTQEARAHGLSLWLPALEAARAAGS